MHFITHFPFKSQGTKFDHIVKYVRVNLGLPWNKLGSTQSPNVT